MDHNVCTVGTCEAGGVCHEVTEFECPPVTCLSDSFCALHAYDDTLCTNELCIDGDSSL